VGHQRPEDLDHQRPPANWIFVLCRTDTNAAKHRGISFLLCPMDQPGVEVRPIRMLSGESEFNEVFFTDARCPAENVVGGVNNGWAVALTLLGYERGESATVLPLRFRRSTSGWCAWPGSTDAATTP